jgi:hypothetical protein
MTYGERWRHEQRRQSKQACIEPKSGSIARKEKCLKELNKTGTRKTRRSNMK